MGVLRSQFSNPLFSEMYFWLKCYYTELFDQRDELDGEKTHRNHLFVRDYVAKQYDFFPLTPSLSPVRKPESPCPFLSQVAFSL